MTLLRLSIALAAASVAFVPPAGAQGDAPPNAAVRAAIDRIKADNAWTIEQQISICEKNAVPPK
jgi:hypothetical protein